MLGCEAKKSVCVCVREREGEREMSTAQVLERGIKEGYREMEKGRESERQTGRLKTTSGEAGMGVD